LFAFLFELSHYKIKIAKNCEFFNKICNIFVTQAKRLNLRQKIVFRFYTHKKRAKNCGQSNTLKQAFSLKKHKFIAQKFNFTCQKIDLSKNANFVFQKKRNLCIKKELHELS